MQISTNFSNPAPGVQRPIRRCMRCNTRAAKASSAPRLTAWPERPQGTRQGTRLQMFPGALLKTLLGTLLPALVCLSASADHGVLPVVQATRDSERVAILRQELQNTKASIEVLTRRHAARLKAADAEGAADVELERARALGDLVALERELAAVSQEGPSAPRRRNADSAPSTDTKPTTRRSDAAAPARWWDVYQQRIGSADASAPPRAGSLSPVPPSVRNKESGT